VAFASAGVFGAHVRSWVAPAASVLWGLKPPVSDLDAQELLAGASASAVPPQAAGAMSGLASSGSYQGPKVILIAPVVRFGDKGQWEPLEGSDTSDDSKAGSNAEDTRSGSGRDS
jgi:hypothetical protein